MRYLEELNKLYCTFTQPDELNNTLNIINNTYSVLFDKIFILNSPDSDEYICTYNVDGANVSSNIIENTILMHRKKESNTLYTINALNKIIIKLNGFLDKKYTIPWNDYTNSMLLINDNVVKKLPTNVYKVVYL